MRDPEHLATLRRMRCALDSPACEGPTEAHHHTGGRGMGQKSSDHRAFPLCRKHHREFHGAYGYFRTWDKEDRKAWQTAQVELYKPAEEIF